MGNLNGTSWWRREADAPVTADADGAPGGAMNWPPWVWRPHEADMCAAHIDEREGQTWK